MSEPRDLRERATCLGVPTGTYSLSVHTGAFETYRLSGLLDVSLNDFKPSFSLWGDFLL